MATAASGAPKANPPLTASEVFGGVFIALGVIACDTVLKAVSLVGGCGPPRYFDTDLFSDLWSVPPCSGTAMAGSAVMLVPASRAGTLFGWFPVFEGVLGQLWGLSLLAVTTVTTIVLMRWRWRSAADALALGALWGGMLVHAGPRLVTDGTTITAIRMFGMGFALGDLVVAWALVWITWRVVAELRA